MAVKSCLNLSLLVGGTNLLGIALTANTTNKSSSELLQGTGRAFSLLTLVGAGPGFCRVSEALKTPLPSSFETLPSKH